MERGKSKELQSPHPLPRRFQSREGPPPHTHVPTIPNPPHIQQEPLQLPTISTNYHTCWERDLINYLLGLEGEPGPRAGLPGLSPLPQVAFQVWGKGLQ